MKKLVKFLYERWFPKQSILERKGEPCNVNDLTPEEQKLHYMRARDYLKEETIKILIEGLAAQSLHRIVFDLSNEPMLFTQAELERAKVAAFDEVLSTLENWSARIVNEEKFDQYKIT